MKSDRCVLAGDPICKGWDVRNFLGMICSWWCHLLAFPGTWCCLLWQLCGLGAMCVQAALGPTVSSKSFNSDILFGGLCFKSLPLPTVWNMDTMVIAAILWLCGKLEGGNQDSQIQPAGLPQQTVFPSVSWEFVNGRSQPDCQQPLQPRSTSGSHHCPSWRTFLVHASSHLQCFGIIFQFTCQF